VKDTRKRAEALLAECETGEEVIELVTGHLDALEGLKRSCEREMAYMDVLEDEGDQVQPLYVSDFLQDMVYSIEENI
jgi:hypothetical protein